MADQLRRIYRKLISGTVENTNPTNIRKGENTFIDPSAVLVTSGKGEIILESNNYIGKDVELGTTGTIIIGNNTSLQDRCIILQDVEIGRSCLFAPNVYISSGRHYFDHRPNLYIKDQDALVAADPKLSKEHSRKVVIGDDCWMGINSVVMSGVTIGRGCIIGANSVVTKDVEPFSIVAGIPAQVVKKRLDFQPKNSIHYSREDDLPNFYKGILVDAKSLAKSKEMGGLIAEENFTLYLTTEGKKLEIELKDLSANTLKLIYNGQERTIPTGGNTSIEFDLGTNVYHQFRIEGAKTVLITSVTIKK
jgi:acetyltransferase-like isoleucine patch superfamily enzyme